MSKATPAAADNTGAAHAKDQTDSDDKANARDDRKALRPAGVEPGRWSRCPALAETGLDEQITKGLSRHSNRGCNARAVAARHTEQFRYGEFDICAIAVVLALVRGDGQRPRAVMPAGRLAVLGFRRSVFMPPAKAQHSRTPNTTHESVQRDNHGEQNGHKAMLHNRSIPRPVLSVA